MIEVTYRYRRARAGYKTVTYTCADMAEANQVASEIRMMWLRGESYEISEKGETIVYKERY